MIAGSNPASPASKMAYLSHFFNNRERKRLVQTNESKFIGLCLKIYSNSSMNLAPNADSGSSHRPDEGGINVALGDLDGDNIDEIVTGPMLGGGPHVKVFSQKGGLVSEFMAYDHDSRAGIIVMSDDIDSDSLDEILVSSLNF